MIGVLRAGHVALVIKTTGSVYSVPVCENVYSGGAKTVTYLMIISLKPSCKWRLVWYKLERKVELPCLIRTHSWLHASKQVKTSHWLTRWPCRLLQREQLTVQTHKLTNMLPKVEKSRARFSGRIRLIRSEIAPPRRGRLIPEPADLWLLVTHSLPCLLTERSRRNLRHR